METAPLAIIAVAFPPLPSSVSSVPAARWITGAVIDGKPTWSTTGRPASQRTVH